MVSSPSLGTWKLYKANICNVTVAINSDTGELSCTDVLGRSIALSDLAELRDFVLPRV